MDSAARPRLFCTLVPLVALIAGAVCSPSAPPSAQPGVETAKRAAPAAEEARASITARTPDAFYDPPANPPSRPGSVLRSEPLEDVTLPGGMRGWRILYTTTVDDRTPATAVATVFVPLDLPAGPHPYLIGEGEARSALDSVRAARQMRELVLDDRTVVWGHSQGGHAALWTGIVGPRYAPDVKVAGVAAIAPAANVQDILAMNLAADKRLGPYVARSYGRFYRDVTFEQALRPQALTARLVENAASGAIAAPVVIVQGLADEVVPPAATDAYVNARCAAAQRLEYWTFAGRDHGSIVRPGTPLEEPLVEWTVARFANEPQTTGCARKSF